MITWCINHYTSTTMTSKKDETVCLIEWGITQKHDVWPSGKRMWNHSECSFILWGRHRVAFCQHDFLESLVNLHSPHPRNSDAPICSWNLDAFLTCETSIPFLGLGTSEPLCALHRHHALYTLCHAFLCTLTNSLGCFAWSCQSKWWSWLWLGPTLQEWPVWWSPSDTIKTWRACKQVSTHCREWWDHTRVCQRLTIAFCNLQPGWLSRTMRLRQLGWWWWHPVRKVKSVRFAFDQIGSMEISGGVLLWFSYCILGLVLGLLVGTDLGLIVWSKGQEHSIEWVNAHM